MNGDPDDFDIADLELTDEQAEKLARVPRKIQKRRKRFVMVPMTWRESLEGATGQTVLLALDLLYLGWRRGGPILLANGMLRYDGISQQSKWRGLAELERRGLVTVERRPRRSPIVTLLRR
jgi:hypothetical protein